MPELHSDGKIREPGGRPLWQLDRVSLGAARLSEVSLEIPAGVTAVIGWSGAGKTSLLNLLAGFEKPDSGAISGAPAVAWVPHNAGLWPHCTAREHLALAQGHERDIEMLLNAFDFGGRTDARPHELSQGEQSRLAVARALVMNFEVLIMDEPLAHVDPARSGKYWRVIRETLATRGASLVFSTHSPEMVLGEAERVICLEEGRAIHLGAARDLYDAPPTEKLMSFLGTGNWFTPDAAKEWLGMDCPAPFCLGPERIVIDRDESGPFIVSSSRFRGSHSETELSFPSATCSRLFVHRPLHEPLQIGMRVKVAVVPI